MAHFPEPLLREVVGHLLRCERHRQGRTLAQLAADSGVSMQHLSDVERGTKDPSSEILAAIAGALGLTVLDLVQRAVHDAEVGSTDSSTRPGHEVATPPRSPAAAPRLSLVSGDGPHRGVTMLSAA